MAGLSHDNVAEVLADIVNHNTTFDYRLPPAILAMEINRIIRDWLEDTPEGLQRKYDARLYIPKK